MLIVMRLSRMPLPRSGANVAYRVYWLWVVTETACAQSIISKAELVGALLADTCTALSNFARTCPR